MAAVVLSADSLNCVPTGAAASSSVRADFRFREVGLTRQL